MQWPLVWIKRSVKEIKTHNNSALDSCSCQSVRACIMILLMLSKFISSLRSHTVTVNVSKFRPTQIVINTADPDQLASEKAV